MRRGRRYIQAVSSVDHKQLRLYILIGCEPIDHKQLRRERLYILTCYEVLITSN